MLKKLAATGVVAVAATGALMVAAPAYADNDGTASNNGGTLIGIPINLSCNNVQANLGVLDGLGLLKGGADKTNQGGLVCSPAAVPGAAAPGAAAPGAAALGAAA